jgi:hypothetical protein
LQICNAVKSILRAFKLLLNVFIFVITKNRIQAILERIRAIYDK